MLDDTGPYVAGKYVMTAEDEETSMDMFEVIGTRVLTAKAPELQTTQEDGRTSQLLRHLKLFANDEQVADRLRSARRWLNSESR